MKRFLRDNGLSLFFAAIFLLALFGQAVSGLARYNQDQLGSGADPVSFWAYVTSSSFAVDVAENWQSEYLQFFLLIVVTVWLVQRGSTESKKLDETGTESDEQQKVGRHARPDSPTWARLGGWRTAVYSRSLAPSWACSSSARCSPVDRRPSRVQRRAARAVRRPGELGRVRASADFWNRTLQNWQSEFLAVGSAVLFSIYLRQRGSPESKPVGAPHEATAQEG